MAEMRQRADRITEERQERRRRNDTTIDGARRLKLAIPDDVAARLEAEGRVPRWINDEGNRLVNLTQYDDYDRVDGVAPVPVGTTKEGKPIMSYLHSKPKAFIDEDRAKADRPRREMEAALLRGKVPGDQHSHDDRYSQGYVDEASSISGGGRRSP